VKLMKRQPRFERNSSSAIAPNRRPPGPVGKGTVKLDQGVKSRNLAILIPTGLLPRGSGRLGKISRPANGKKTSLEQAAFAVLYE